MLANAHATIKRAGDMNELTVVRGRWESCVCFRKDLNVSYLPVSKGEGMVGVDVLTVCGCCGEESQVAKLHEQRSS
jgi:hypothetical protein